MPIVDVEIVRQEDDRDDASRDSELVRRLANVIGEVFASPPRRTWVRLRTLSAHCYAENNDDTDPNKRTLPVFITVLKAVRPDGESLRREVRELTERVAELCERPAANVHVLYLPDAAGRIAFGGRLVESPR